MGVPHISGSPYSNTHKLEKRVHTECTTSHEGLSEQFTQLLNQMFGAAQSYNMVHTQSSSFGTFLSTTVVGNTPMPPIWN